MNALESWIHRWTHASPREMRRDFTDFPYDPNWPRFAHSEELLREFAIKIRGLPNESEFWRSVLFAAVGPLPDDIARGFSGAQVVRVKARARLKRGIQWDKPQNLARNNENHANGEKRFG